MQQLETDRINELARKARTVGLDADEVAEQAALRAAYLAEFRASFSGVLAHTVVERPDGTREALPKKKP